MIKAKTVLTATIGNAIVYYDITLYGFFTVYLSPFFFPADNLTTSQLASLGVFAAGFIARPFGGLLFGHIGDRYGRRKALVTAILLVTIPTTIIGLLPTYSSIGIFAPLILILCKIMQGICTGGEYSGAAIFLSEHHRGKGEGFAGSILPASSIVGAIVGTSLGGLCILPNMPSWAWRIPFILGGLFGLLGYFLRSALMESPEFQTKQKENSLHKIPILEVIKQDKQPFLCAFALSTYNIVLFYIPVVYIAQFMISKDTLASSGMFLNTGLMVTLIFLLPLMGHLSDRIGKPSLMKTSIIASALLAFPLFLFIHRDGSLVNVFLVMAVFAILMSASVAPSVSFLPSLFPTQERYSALAMAIGLGEALGGTTPLICHGLVAATNSPISPAFFLMICSACALLALNSSQSRTAAFVPIIPKELKVANRLDSKIKRRA